MGQETNCSSWIYVDLLWKKFPFFRSFIKRTSSIELKVGRRVVTSLLVLNAQKMLPISTPGRYLIGEVVCGLPAGVTKSHEFGRR